MNKLFEKYSNLSISVVVLILITLLIVFGAKVFGFSSDALLSLISAVIGGLIATSSQAWISAQDRRNQLRLAALDKRLQAHQDAYFRWRKLLFNVSNEKTIAEIVIESQNWWEENCIFLEPNARKYFYLAIQRAGSHLTYLRNRENELVQENMRFLESIGEIILAGVELPTIGELESKNIQVENIKRKK